MTDPPRRTKDDKKLRVGAPAYAAPMNYAPRSSYAERRSSQPSTATSDAYLQLRTIKGVRVRVAPWAQHQTGDDAEDPMPTLLPPNGLPTSRATMHPRQIFAKTKRRRWSDNEMYTTDPTAGPSNNRAAYSNDAPTMSPDASASTPDSHLDATTGLLTSGNLSLYTSTDQRLHPYLGEVAYSDSLVAS